MTPAIVFRADASHALGLGHVARLCALIEELGPDDAQPIAMFGGDAELSAWVSRHGIAGTARPPGQPWSAAEVLAAAAEPRVRAVVVDGPTLATALAPALIERGVRTVVIDDRGGCALAVDAIVNHNFHAPTLAGGYPGARLRLLGRDYLLLRRTVRRYPRGSCRPKTGARLRVIVSFGGSDPVGATARTLHLIPPDRPVDLVVLAGPGFRDDEALRRAAQVAAAAGHTVQIVHGSDDPGSLFVHADAAICSAGGTLGELAYLGCPALGFAIVPDQVPCARNQVRGGLIAGGRTWSETDDDTLRAELLAFLADDRGRRGLRQRALATATGNGARRVVNEALG